MITRVARPSVLRGVSHTRHAIIEASAGTGKTFTLEHLVVDLLLTAGVTLDRVLVVTFTEKATNELRLRIRSKLEEIERGAARAPDAAEVRAGDYWTIDDAARAKIAAALRAFDGATITTIHAFCQRVLRENAFASGRLFDEEQIDGRDAFGRAMRDALRRQVAGHPTRGPWLEAALRQGYSIARIEELLWKCASARAELRPTVDVEGLARAVDAMPEVGIGDTSIVDVLRSCGLKTQTAKAVGHRVFRLSEAALRSREERDLPSYVLEADGIDHAKVVTDCGALAGLKGAAGAACAAAVELARCTPPFRAALAEALLPPTLDLLVRTKREVGRYDFDDMLSLLDAALAGPRGGALADSMRRRWRYALVDEFQDTDETQWSIFRRAFFEPREARSCVFLVGDPKQSIYRFRGADVQTYLRAVDEVASDGGSRVALEQNFRATPELVEATNAVFDPQASEPIFQGDVSYAAVGCGRPDRTLVDGSGRSLSPVHVLRLRNELSLEAIAAVIAREIRAATHPRSPWLFDGRPLELRDFFVLTRTTREGRAIGAVLRRAGIAHAYFKEEGLFQTDEARDLLALLNAIGNPDDRACRLSAWLTPFFGLSLAGIERARDVGAGHPLVERLKQWRAIADAREFGRLFEAIVQESGVVRRLVFFADGEREITNYLHLLELLLERARASHATLVDLTSELAGLIGQTRLPLRLEGNVQRLESERRSVQIMTIHKAKGLEAPVVFVAGGGGKPRSDDVRIYHEHGRRLAWVGEQSEAVKPLVRPEETEEDQRLVYVALTRAQGRLYLPSVVDDAGRPKRLSGAYERMNRRVHQVVAGGSPLVSVEDVAESVGRLRLVRAEAPGDFSPPPRWFEAPADATRYERLRRQRRGLLLTSYTRMKGDRGTVGAWADVVTAAEQEAFAEERDHAGPAVLRSARSSGVFLHELLERLPLAAYREAGDAAEWIARADVRAVFDEAMAVHQVEPSQRAHAERIAWSAYKTPTVLPTGETLAGLACASAIAREMPFVFAKSRAADERVLVRGSIDMAFQHEGLTYFVDWKSDSMSSYSPDAVARRVAERYEGQLRIYTIAVARLVGVDDRATYERRFGGLLYCFLRGSGVRGEGVYALRPSFDDLQRWASELEAWKEQPS